MTAVKGLSREQLERYSRNIAIGLIGAKGQLKLLSSKVLVVGAGGLGSPILLYLAAAGIGTIGIVDSDVVDLGNLQRQIAHGSADVGRRKVDSAAESIARLNPEVRVNLYPERFTRESAGKLLASYDAAIDATDNFETRYVLNDVCIEQGKPFIHGSVMRFEGQASVFWPPRGPCYRCVFPAPPGRGLLPSAAEAGVLGCAPGVIGCVEAMETVKILLGIGKPLMGRLLLFDGLSGNFGEVSLKRDPSCPSCGSTAGSAWG